MRDGLDKSGYAKKNNEYAIISGAIKNGNYEFACDKVEEFLKKYPKDLYAKNDYARCLINLDRGNEALDILMKLKENNLNDLKDYKIAFQTYISIIRYYNSQKDLDNVKFYSNEAYDKKVFDDFEYKYNIAYCYYELGYTNQGNQILFSANAYKEEYRHRRTLELLCRNNDEYYKKHSYNIEKELKEIIKKSSAKRNIAIQFLIKYYTITGKHKEGYEYIRGINKDRLSVECLINCYYICINSGHYELANEYKKYINNIPMNSIESVYAKAKVYALNGDFESAVKSSENIKSYKILITCVSWKIKLKDYDGALKLLEKTIEDTGYISDRVTSSLLLLADLYIYYKQYDKAYQALNTYAQQSINKNQMALDVGFTFLASKTGMPYENVNETYIIKQIKNYSYEEALKHISKHSLEDESKQQHTVFNPNINIYNLMQEVQSKLTKSNLDNVGAIDRYIIDYPNVSLNQYVNKLIICTIGGTKNIIVCYPCNDYNNSLLELDDEIEVESSPKVKRLSQIEKFNKKYNLNN